MRVCSSHSVAELLLPHTKCPFTFFESDQKAIAKLEVVLWCFATFEVVRLTEAEL